MAPPTDPPVKILDWAELHVDQHIFRLVKPWRLEELEEMLEAAMINRRVVKVRVYTEFDGETTVLVNPSRATVIYLTKRPELVPENEKGMPDP